MFLAASSSPPSMRCERPPITQQVTGPRPKLAGYIVPSGVRGSEPSGSTRLTSIDSSYVSHHPYRGPSPSPPVLPRMRPTRFPAGSILRGVLSLGLDGTHNTGRPPVTATRTPEM